MTHKTQTDFCTRYVAQVQERFQADIASHVVKQIHGDGDVVKLWRCGRPDSSNMMFYVCSAPGCLMTYGDMGECMWQREYDMIPWVRGSVGSSEYFAEKVPHNITIREEKPELIEEWFSTVKSDRIESGEEWTGEHDEALTDIRAEYQSYETAHDFKKAIYESCLCSDCESLPDVTFYTYRYLWIVEGLKWFIAKLDAGEIVTGDSTGDTAK